MRIALLNDRIPPEGRGGAENVVWRLAQGLQSDGHDVHIIATTPDDPFDEVRDGIPTHHIHANYPTRWRAWLSLYNPQTAKPLRQLFRQIQPDVVNAHNIHFYLSYHSLKIAHDLGIPTVFTSHDPMPFVYTKLTHFIQRDSNAINIPDDYRIRFGFNLRQNRFRYNPFRNHIIKHYLTRYATVRTTVSHAMAEAHTINGLPPFEVVHNGIDLEAWSSVDTTIVEALREQLNLRDKKVILIAGRLSSHKGTHQILAALSRLTERLPDVRLLVLTAGDINKQIPAEFDTLQSFIVSGGWLSGDELVAAYHVADVLVTPSMMFDPFPTVNLEGMAVGLPVIATAFGGSREVVVDSETGYIINPLDTDAFSDYLYRLLTDRELRQRMGEAGQTRIRQEFTLDHHIEKMLHVYRQAIKTVNFNNRSY